jgi:conjugative transfer signal peptidase TraF
VVIGAVVAGGADLASHLTINLTDSLPRGLYWLRPTAPPFRGDTVALAVPDSIKALVAQRRYLPPSFRLLKRVVATSGDAVCLSDHLYVVNGLVISSVATTDRSGRPLPPPYPFCGVVADGTAYLAAAGDSSLDSRYFGPVPMSQLTRAVPLWTSF